MPGKLSPYEQALGVRILVTVFYCLLNLICLSDVMQSIALSVSHQLIWRENLSVSITCCGYFYFMKPMKYTIASLTTELSQAGRQLLLAPPLALHNEFVITKYLYLAVKEKVQNDVGESCYTYHLA